MWYKKAEFETAEDFARSLKNSEELSAPNNETETPYSGDFTEGEQFADATDIRLIDHGHTPFVYESRYVNPKDLIGELYLEGRTYDEVVNMPTTQKYIEWYRAGHEPPPITIVLTDKDQNQRSINRRRVVAAIEAGIDRIPALIEVGKADEVWSRRNL